MWELDWRRLLLQYTKGGGEGFSEQKCQQENQVACLPSDDAACAPLQIRSWAVVQHKLRKLCTFQMKCLQDKHSDCINKVW